MIIKLFSKLSAVLITTSLAACGGGGGGNSTSPPPVAVTCTSPQVLVNGVCTNPAVTPANLQTSVPLPTYQAGSVELLAFTELNNFRKMVGLGLLAQNSKIDLAAANHANYIAANIDSDLTLFGHYEVATKAGFTGIAPGDRTAFAGYGPVASEVATSNNYNGDQQSPVQRFFGSVYHRSVLLAQCPKDVGIGFQNHTTPGGLIVNPVIIDLGFNQVTGCQTNASDFVYSYPVADQKNVPVTMAPETPDPFEVPKDQNGIDDWKNNSSYPITIGVNSGYTLTMDSFTVTEQGQATALPMRVINNSNDRNKLILKYEMVFVGYAPFKSATTYNVVFKGAANGTPFTKSFSITTK